MSISEYKNKNNKIKNNQNENYNFIYGKNVDEPEFLKNNYKTNLNNDEI